MRLRLNHSERPVQVIYSGKAHPHDDAGKPFIQAIIELAKRPEFRKKLVFLENYGMATAWYMVQGCEIWLNTPLRPTIRSARKTRRERNI